jgi:predicted nucleic acid-binding protein
MSALVDTSCLLRLSGENDPREAATQMAMDNLSDQGTALAVAPQNFVEFRAVATRPAAANGLGLTPENVEAELDRFGLMFALLPEDGFYVHWRDLCRQAGVSGKQVHDTRLVAVCAANGVQTILTWNPADFVRFIPFMPGLVVLTPDQVLAGA